MTPVPLAQALDESLYGGKAVQLGTALRSRLPVPPGHALPVALVDAVAAGASAARAVVLELARSLGGPQAVRSSAVGEDSAGASFAGQHLTRLNVRTPEEVVDAVVEVWRSGRSEGALAYRRRLGVSATPQMAVVLQRLVDPDCAGVLFTRNPLDGSDERLIEATWGLGEAVVAGLVTPDRFRVSRSGVILERLAGVKDIAIVSHVNGGTIEMALPADRVEPLCLSDPELVQLHELATRCEQVYGGTQDIEWAFAGGALHLLQRRQLTRMPGSLAG